MQQHSLQFDPGCYRPGVGTIFLVSPWRKALVVAVTIPLSVAKNGLRIFVITMLGTKVDPGFLTGRLHHDGGVVFLALALGAICVLLWALEG
jgi:exosortase/archaeosortase family protein